MKNNATLLFSVVLILGDFLALLAAFTVAYILRVKLDPRPLIEQIPALTYFFAFMVVLPLWILVHAFMGLYNHEVYEKRFSELGRLFIGSFLGILVVIGYNFVTNGQLFPARLVPVYGLGLGFSFLVLFRSLARFLRQALYLYGIGINNVLLIGDTAASIDIAKALCDTRRTGQRVLGIVGASAKWDLVYPSFQEALAQLRRPLHSVIQTELYANTDKNNEILRYAQENHVAYRFVPGNSDLFVGNIAVELFAGLPMVAVHQTALTGWGRVAKRLFDLFAGSLLLLVASPLILFIMLLLRFFNRGPIFFRQTRLTRFNQTFRVFKFRTLKIAYNGITPEEAFTKMGKPGLSKKYRENGDYLENDPRLTRIGRFLRRTSLDELPQLFNVIKGELSLVGPRALVPEELNLFAKKHAVLSVKSGLTGLAQISGRKNISFEERRKLDVFYVQTWTFWLDIVILVKTVRVVLSGSGAK